VVVPAVNGEPAIKHNSKIKVGTYTYSVPAHALAELADLLSSALWRTN
jgi:hypothetical protein